MPSQANPRGFRARGGRAVEQPRRRSLQRFSRARASPLTGKIERDASLQKGQSKLRRDRCARVRARRSGRLELHAFAAPCQSFQMRRRASPSEMRPSQTARARQASTPSFRSASDQGSSRRLRGSSGAPPSASGMTWSSSKRLLSASVSPRSRSFASLIAFVTAKGGRTVLVQPRTQIVASMVACVTSGLSGRLAAWALEAKAKSAKIGKVLVKERVSPEEAHRARGEAVAAPSRARRESQRPPSLPGGRRQFQHVGVAAAASRNRDSQSRRERPRFRSTRAKPFRAAVRSRP